MTIKARFPLLLLLLGVLFLASVCVSYGIAQGNPCHQKCLQRCKRMNVASKRHECRERCGESSKEKSCEGEEEEEEEEEEERPPRHWEPERRERGRRERGRQEGEKEEEERDGGGRVRDRKERSRRLRHGESESESHGRNNPYLFRSNRFETIFENDHGYIRLLQRFDKRSKLLENLQNYRIVEYKSKPHTLFLPHHIDADFILVVLSGKAILTVVNTNDRDTYNLERGDAIRLPAGTIAYLANRDDQEDLRVVDLVIPINRPGRFNSFVAASSPKSYFNGFSKDFLEAAFNSDFEEIERVLLGEQEQEQQQRHRGGSQQGDAIVKVSREQIEQISRHAKSSSRKSVSSESEPFNLRSRSPIYSNKFGKFYEITPEKSPQLQDLDVFLSCAEIKEGAIMLPHYNSRAIIIGVVNEGKGELELVGLRNPQQEQEEEEEEEEEEESSSSPEVHRYRARLSPGDVFVIPSSHPVAVNASSDLYLLGFGINAENNQRNFLAGEEENVISQIQRPVKEVAFPGSAQEVERLFKNQRQSYFADGQPQQREEGSQRRRGPLSSILGAFY